MTQQLLFKPEPRPCLLTLDNIHHTILNYARATEPEMRTWGVYVTAMINRIHQDKGWNKGTIFRHVYELIEAGKLKKIPAPIQIEGFWVAKRLLKQKHELGYGDAASLVA